MQTHTYPTIEALDAMPLAELVKYHIQITAKRVLFEDLQQQCTDETDPMGEEYDHYAAEIEELGVEETYVFRRMMMLRKAQREA